MPVTPIVNKSRDRRKKQFERWNLIDFRDDSLQRLLLNRTGVVKGQDTKLRDIQSAVGEGSPKYVDNFVLNVNSRSGSVPIDTENREELLDIVDWTSKAREDVEGRRRTHDLTGFNGPRRKGRVWNDLRGSVKCFMELIKSLLDFVRHIFGE